MTHKLRVRTEYHRKTMVTLTHLEHWISSMTSSFLSCVDRRNRERERERENERKIIVVL